MSDGGEGRGGREPDVHFTFGHDPGAARRARAALDAMLTDPDDVIADDVRLAASELVTNVIVHTSDGGELRAWDPQPEVPLRIEVEDADAGAPAIPLVAPEQGGRGLAIVEAVADQWGVDRGAIGKVLWAEFDRDQRAGRTDPDRGPARGSDQGPIAGPAGR